MFRSIVLLSGLLLIYSKGFAQEELPRNWELSFNLNYEDKIEVYSNWLFGIGFSKRLP